MSALGTQAIKHMVKIMSHFAKRLPQPHRHRNFGQLISKPTMGCSLRRFTGATFYVAQQIVCCVTNSGIFMALTQPFRRNPSRLRTRPAAKPITNAAATKTNVSMAFPLFIKQVWLPKLARLKHVKRCNVLSFNKRNPIDKLQFITSELGRLQSHYEQRTWYTRCFLLSAGQYYCIP